MLNEDEYKKHHYPLENNMTSLCGYANHCVIVIYDCCREKKIILSESTIKKSKESTDK